MTDIVTYRPPKTIKAFIRHHVPAGLFYSWIVGAFGSGKTTANFFKLVWLAKQQVPGRDGVRRTSAVVVRNTASQLVDTTIKSWNLWFKDGEAGKWLATPKNFILRFDDVECEVMFRPLDTPDDVERVLSLEVTFAIIDEFVQIPRAIVEALSGRVGRYPSEKDGGATNWGIWGSSNTDTEDCWWYEYLYKSPEVSHYSGGAWETPDERKARLLASGLEETIDPRVIAYFLQPGGLSPGAENLDHLPGGRNYYVNLAKGKSDAWRKQFIDAEWGFSAAGKPVISSFEPARHVALQPLKFNPLIPLVIGLDPGVTCSAFIFTQMDLWGRLLVFGELIQEGMGASRLIEERLKPYLRLRFPQARVIISPDPAANNRSQTDERSVVDVFKKHYEVKVETNNQLPIRLEAIDHFTTRSVEAGPALLIDPKHCPILIRALKGGWRWEMNKKEVLKSVVEDNIYSHPGDSLGYAARYHYRLTEKEARYGLAATQRPFIPRRSFDNHYHVK